MAGSFINRRAMIRRCGTELSGWSARASARLHHEDEESRIRMIPTKKVCNSVNEVGCVTRQDRVLKLGEAPDHPLVPSQHLLHAQAR